MLLKYSQAEKRTRPNGNKQQRATGAMKLNVGLPGPRVGRKVMRGIATKRTALGQQRPIAVRTSERTAVDPCENSNDSGLGFDHHLELQLAARSTVRFADQEASWANDHIEVKRKKLEIKLEADEANDNFGFPENMNRRGRQVDEPQRIQESIVRNLTKQQNMPIRPIASQTTGLATSRNGRTQLQIISQPESQHRARYQTEGSRGAVKDRTGNGFPMVKLTNYNKPAVLSVYIGTDVGKVQPHMFYQACRVSGKNSTPCTERKETGTIYIDVEFDPAKDYVITCDCVGILKERNVDVEHRFPHADQGRHKKKSTRCRMVFKTMIEHDDNSTELLQITSHPIVCTQPPGIPEICKKSLSSSPCTGGLELFILGKNFLKDTRVMFQQTEADTPWEDSVQPDKEFLQQTHLVCVVPPYRRTDITESVTVRLVVMSSGKTSEPHTFTYTPALSPEGTHPCVTMVPSAAPHGVFPRSPLVLSDITTARSAKNSPKKSPYLPIDATQSAIEGDSQRLMMWPAPSLIPAVETCKPESKELDRIMSGKMMPPPPLLPISARRVSSNVRLIIPEPESSVLKTELTEDGNSQNLEDVKGIDLRLKPVATVNPMGSSADLASTQAPTLATFQRFVSGNNSAPLPTQSGPSVEKYLSNLEHVPDPNVVTKSASDHVAPTCKIDTVAQTLFAQPMIYGSQAVECKPRFNPDEAPLMQQARRKSMYEENLSSDPVLGQTVSSMIDPLTTSSPLLMYAGTERARQVPSETDKLDALVNSAAASHMSSPIPVKKMTLDPPSYDLMCTPLGVEANATYSSHDRTSPIAIKSILNGTAEGQILVSSPTRVDSLPHGSTSPIAVKTILNGTTGESQIIVASPSLSHGSTSPIVGKNILNITGENQTFVQSPTRIDTLSHDSRSPSAGKKMVESTHENGMLVTNTTGRMDQIAMKTILNSEVPSLIGAPQELSSDRSGLNSLVQEGVLATATQATSTESACLSTLSQSALNQQQTLLTSSAHVSAESSRLNALVQSTLNSQQDSVLASASSDRSSQLTTLAQSALNQQQTLLASSAQVSAESARLNALVQSTLSSQQESVLGSGSPECARLNTLAQTALNQQQSLLASGAQVSAESARLNALVQSTLSNQPESVLAPASPESARLNSLAQSALNQQQSLLASGAQVSVESARLNALVQSTLSTQESVLASGSTESARLNMAQSALNQQQNLLASSAQVSVESARLNALVQSTLNNQQEDVLSSVAQVSSGESAHVNTLAQSALSQQQQQTLLASSAHVSPESARLNALVQSTLNSQQENVLVCGVQTTTSESATLNSLVQSSFSSQQENVLVCVAQTTSAADNGQLNTLAQSGFGQQQMLLTSSAHVSAESARLNALVQSTLNSQQNNVLAQASSSNSARLNALLQDSMLGSSGTQASGSQGNSGAQSQPASEALLSTMFSGSQNASSQFTNKQDNRTGFAMQMQQKQEKVQSGPATGQPPQKKNEEGMVPSELAQMSENDLLSYINPSTFDQGF